MNKCEHVRKYEHKGYMFCSDCGLNLDKYYLRWCIDDSDDDSDHYVLRTPDPKEKEVMKIS